jgi:outer membrane protein assembly factor BamA
LRKPADYFAPVTYAGSFSVDIGASSKGSRFGVVSFQGPLLWDGWRLVARAGATREARFGFYGLGNASVNDESLVTSAQPFLYRVRRTRYFGGAQASRRLAHYLWLALGAGVEHSRFSALPGPSVFRTTYGADLQDDDLIGSATLVFDTRDNEYNTHKGIILETGFSGGSGGGGYSRLTVVARGYLQVREGTVLGLRLGGASMGGSPPLNARFEIPVWEGVLQVLGGAASHRGLSYGRLAGEDALFINADVRHDLLNLGDLGGITLLAFADAGRVFENEPFKLTTTDMKLGAGGGVAVRVLRGTIFTFNFSGGSEGFVFTTGAGWTF